MPSKVHDKTDSLDKPVNLLTKQKPTDPKTLHDRVDEANIPKNKKDMLHYEANKYIGIPKGKNSKSNKGGKRRKSKKTKKSLKRH